MPILPYILRKEQRFGTKFSRIRLIITLFATSWHSQPPITSRKFWPFRFSLVDSCFLRPDMLITVTIIKCIESTKRLIYFITKNNVPPSHLRQICCFNLSLLNIIYIRCCFNDFSLVYHDIILFTCISID